MRTRAIGIVATIAMFGAVLGPTPSARAQRPFAVQIFEPNGTPAASTFGCSATPPGTPPGCIADYLSDKFDGVDSLAHLTAVATLETTELEFRACPVGTTVTTQAALTSCNVVIGTDVTGLAPPIGAGASSPAAEAYEVTWDIPAALDQQRRDVVAIACIGTGRVVDGGSANCRVAEEDSIFLEDAQTGAAGNQATAGEFGQYRARQGCFDVSPGNAACDAAFKAFPHGSPVPNDGFDFKAFTSDDVQSVQVIVNAPASAQDGPNSATLHDFATCTLEQAFTNFKRWRCGLGDALVPDNAELGISVLKPTSAGEPTGSGGYCNGNNNPSTTDHDPNTGGNQGPPPAQNQVPGAHDGCILDVHYVVSSARQAANFVQTLAPNPPSPSANASCANPDTDETSQLGTTEDATLCLFDQFNDPIAGQWTEETAGQGQIADCGPDGTGHDHNGDGLFEDCVGNTGADGVSTGLTFQNPSGPTGDQTLTGCHDPQNQTTNPPVANHGCGDAGTTLKKTKVIHWGTTPGEVFLAFNNPAPSDPADPCLTGLTSKSNEVGDHDDITVCTLDSHGNLISTDTNATRLQWTITAAQGGQPTAVGFGQATPPDETSGPAASAQTTIDALQEGSNFVNVVLVDGHGDPIDAFSLQKEVRARRVFVPTRLTARVDGKLIRGRAVAEEDECEPNRSVTLFRRRRGPDDAIGPPDSTNRLGRWAIRVDQTRATYYARVEALSTIDSQNGAELNCLPDQSNEVRRI